MGDDNERTLTIAQRVNAVSDNLQGVNIQTGVGLIQNAQRGFQNRHLQDVVAFFFTPRETNVNRAGEQILRHFQQFDLLFHQILEIEAVQRLQAAILAHRIQRRLQEELVTDARDFYRVLEGHKDALSRTIFRGHFQQIFAVKFDRAVGHFIIFTACQRR